MSLKKKQYEENGSDSEFKYARKNAPEKDDTVSILIVSQLPPLFFMK